jgi:hypothetical protein
MEKNNMIFSGKLYLNAVLMLLILVISTACQSKTKQSMDSKTAAIPQFNPVIVAEGAVDTKDSKGIAVKETIRIWMTDGKEITYTEPGPFQGTFRTGKFEAVAERDGKELARLGLNDAFDGGEMIFPKAAPFKLQFDDYNGDGQAEFTIGQWNGSNGSFYSILTIGPSSFSILEKNIYSADQRPSIRYRKAGNTAFLNKYYDQVKGAYMDVTHRWKEAAFYKDAPVLSKDVGAAGIEDTPPKQTLDKILPATDVKNDVLTVSGLKLETAESTLRAFGKSALGRIRIVSLGKETIETLGAPSCLGNEADYRIQGSYKVLFEKTNEKDKLIVSLNETTIISPSMNPIPMEKLQLGQVELFTFYPQYQDCHGIQMYLFGVDNQTGDAYPFTFVIDGKTYDSYSVKPGTMPVVDNDQLIIMVSTGPGGEVPENEYVFKADLKNHRMELVNKLKSSK